MPPLFEKEKKPQKLQSIKNTPHYGIHLSSLSPTVMVAGRCYYTHVIGEQRGKRTQLVSDEVEVHAHVC